MLGWAARKRLIIFIGVVFVLILILGFPTYLLLNRPGDCFDGKQNNGEDGIDCGGSCAHVCDFQAADLITRWARFVKIKNGLYDAVALIENPNFTAGVSEISYTFQLYDKDASFIVERTGETFVNQNEQFAIFESGIEVGNRLPTRITFEFSGKPYWIRARREKPDLLIKNKILENIEIKPRLSAELQNQSLNHLRSVLVTGLLLNRDENLVAASQTLVSDLPPNASRNLVFTWPSVFNEKPQVCVNPLDVMLVFDRSGSMNDDGKDPPQPLTDARNAAATFIDKLVKVDQVGLVTFATNVSDPIDHPLSVEKLAVRNTTTAIEILPADEIGFTNLGAGIEKATLELNSNRHNIEAKKIIIILTDGLANYPEVPGGELYAREKASEAKSGGITIYVIGLGDEVNTDFLSGNIASGRNRYFAAPKRTDLIRIYNEIAQVVCPEKTYLINLFPRVNLMTE